MRDMDRAKSQRQLRRSNTIVIVSEIVRISVIIINCNLGSLAASNLRNVISRKHNNNNSVDAAPSLILVVYAWHCQFDSCAQKHSLTLCLIPLGRTDWDCARSRFKLKLALDARLSLLRRSRLYTRAEELVLTAKNNAIERWNANAAPVAHI